MQIFNCQYSSLVHFRSWEKCWGTMPKVWSSEMRRWIGLAFLEVIFFLVAVGVLLELKNYKHFMFRKKTRNVILMLLLHLFFIHQVFIVNNSVKCSCVKHVVQVHIWVTNRVWTSTSPSTSSAQLIKGWKIFPPGLVGHICILNTWLQLACNGGSYFIIYAIAYSTLL